MFETLDYDPDKGKIYNKITRSSRALKGEEAGSITVHGYKQVWIHNRYYKSSHIAWYKIHNELPNMIDHINHNTLDDRIVNLRLATSESNMRNKSMDRRCKYPVQGIFKTPSGKYKVTIGHKWKRINIGLFDTLDEAVENRLQAERDYGYHENHGNKK